MWSFRPVKNNYLNFNIDSEHGVAFHCVMLLCVESHIFETVIALKTFRPQNLHDTTIPTHSSPMKATAYAFGPSGCTERRVEWPDYRSSRWRTLGQRSKSENTNYQARKTRKDRGDGGMEASSFVEASRRGTGISAKNKLKKNKNVK